MKRRVFVKNSSFTVGSALMTSCLLSTQGFADQTSECPWEDVVVGEQIMWSGFLDIGDKDMDDAEIRITTALMKLGIETAREQYYNGIFTLEQFDTVLTDDPISFDRGPGVGSSTLSESACRGETTIPLESWTVTISFGEVQMLDQRYVLATQVTWTHRVKNPVAVCS